MCWVQSYHTTCDWRHIWLCCKFDSNFAQSCCCCCCCHDEPVRHCLYGGGDKDVPKRWGNPPDSESGGIRLSLVIVDGHFIDLGTTQGRLSLPTADVLSTIVKRSMLTDVDKLSSCSRFSDSVVGFTGQKTQPTASKYWRSTIKLTWNMLRIRKCVVDVCVESRRCRQSTLQCLRVSAWYHWPSDLLLPRTFMTSWRACLLLGSGIISVFMIIKCRNYR